MDGKLLLYIIKTFNGFEFYKRDTKNHKKGDLKKVACDKKKTMTLIEKKLLISDLCARLPYGVKVACTDGVVQLKSVDFELGSDNPVFWHGGQGTNLTIEDDNIKPYLIPISKMTEEQRLEIEIITRESIGFDTYSLYDFTGYSEISLSSTMEIIQWCYENHIDINGLIPIGLANDATGLNIY